MGQHQRDMEESNPFNKICNQTALPCTSYLKEHGNPMHVDLYYFKTNNRR